MSNQTKSGAVLFAKNISAIATFYQELLSMVVIHAEGDRIIVLESSSFHLVVHTIPAEIADSIQISTPPLRRTEMPIKLFFFVPSIADARQQAVALGGELNPQEREWESQKFRACDGHDPEGNVFQVRESIRLDA